MKKISLGLLLVLMLAISGCGLLESPVDETADVGGEEVELGYVQWACAEAQTHIVQEVLQRLDYDVELSVLQAGALFEGVATGDLDAYTSVWLPVTHADYWDNIEDDVVNLGTNFEGARIGLVVPDYVDIDSIDELADNYEKFDGEIVGIDPGAGIMQATEDEVIPDYGLEDWELLESSGPAMTAELASAIENEEWVVVTGWNPHWKFAEMDVKYLEDPRDAYGEAENIKSMGRKNIEEDLPNVAHVLEEFKLDDELLGSVMSAVNDGMEPEDAAEEFVNNNLELVNGWLPDDLEIE